MGGVDVNRKKAVGFKLSDQPSSPDGRLRSKHTFPRARVTVDETRSVFVKSEICKNVRATKGFLT